MKKGSLAAGVAALYLAANSQAFAADKALIEAARKEGSVTWYTTLIVNQFVRPAAAAFEKKYGVKINFSRMNTEDVILRAATEAKAGKVHVDVVDGTSTVGPLKKLGIIAKYSPESGARLPAEYKDKDGFWTATNAYVFTPAVNTDLIPLEKAPKTFEALLDPSLKGKLGWSSLTSTSSAPGFVGAAINYMGEEKATAYLKKLAAQNIVGIKLSARAVVDKMNAGEFAVALQTFNHHSVISAKKGAPSRWYPLELTLTNLSVEGIMKDAPHPNAARLLVDFLVSREGQELFKKAGYLPVDPQVPPDEPALMPEGGKFKARVMTPEEVDAELPKWQKIAADIFR